MAKKMMLVDGNSIINRGFYGVPLLTDSQGRYTNAVYGFLNIILKLLDEEQPDYLAVAFDLKAPTFRHKTFAEYKGNRKGMPEELRGQVPLLKEVLGAMHVCCFEKEGYEADDILGTLSKMAVEQGVFPVVVSGDRDLLQLAAENVKIRIPKTKGGKTEVEDYYATDVFEKYGVTPEEFIDLKALMGDASDNIPGVPGIGEKTATKIIQAYHNIEDAIAHGSEIKPKRASENIVAFQEQARLSKFLATIIRDMPLKMDLEKMSIDDLFNPDAYEWMKQLEFKSILSRFSPREKQNQPTAPVKTRSITETEQCEKVFEEVKKESVVAYGLWVEKEKLCGMALYCENLGGIWFEVSEHLSAEALCAVAKSFLESKEIGKIGNHVKQDKRFLRQYGITLDGIVFDTTLGAYLLNPVKDQYPYDDLAREFLGELLPTKEEVLGKGKSMKSIFDLEVSQRVEFLIKQVEVLYRCREKLEQKLIQTGQKELYDEIELPLVDVLADMEEYGISVDRQALETFQSRLEKEIESITEEIFLLSGEEFNLNSPKQLGVILFEKLGLKGGKKTKTGYSTAADVLEKLKTEHPMVEKILWYRQLAKLKSTYADGLLAVLNPKTDKIYSTFQQTVTATGRISSTEPNLQNIPIRLELGRELRKVFIPSEGFCFLDGDYSQIELRVLAHIAGDETLIDAFQNKQDIHRLTASQVFNTPFEEVTPLQRSNAKAVNFGIVYGIGAFSLSQDLGITRKEAERYMEGYFAKYPKIKVYMDKTIADAKEKGYVATLWGRRRLMPELQSGNFIQRAFGERVAMNMPIQGSAADIIKIAMVKVHHALQEKGMRSRLILQVHDELLVETHLEEVEAVKQILKENMEQAVSLAVPLDVDVHEGNSWFEAK